MTASKRKDSARPVTPPNQTASQSALSPTSHPPTLTVADTVLTRLMVPDPCSAYITTPNLTQRVEFQAGKHTDMLIRKDTDMEFILHGVFLVARNECFLAPDANFDPDNPYNMHFKDAKLSCRLTTPTTPTDFPFAVSDFPKCIGNLRSIEKIVKLEKGMEVSSAVGDHLGKLQFKIQHSLFEPKPVEVAMEPNDSPGDVDTVASGTLAEDEDLGSEFTMESWPVAAQCEESLEMLFGTHDICPLPAYDSHDSLIPPSLYETMLKGATVEVDFSYSHAFLKKKNKHYFSTSLRRMKILQAPSALPSSPFKRVKVSAASGKGKGRV